MIELADQCQSLLPTPAILERALRAANAGPLGPEEIHRWFENLSTPDEKGPEETP